MQRIICNYNVLPKTQTFIFNAILFTISMWNKFIVYHEQIYINNSLPFKVFHLITNCYKIFFKSCGSKLAYHFKIAQYRAEIGRIHYSTIFTSWCPIKCNITKKKLRIFQPIEFSPLSAIVILWCQRDARIDHDILKLWYEFHFFLTHRLLHRSWSLIFVNEFNLPASNWYLNVLVFFPIWFTFHFLFLSDTVLKMPGSFEVNQWNWL